MAKLLHSAKSGSEWTDHDLRSYNISVTQVDALEFFGLEVSLVLSHFGWKAQMTFHIKAATTT